MTGALHKTHRLVALLTVGVGSLLYTPYGVYAGDSAKFIPLSPQLPYLTDTTWGDMPTLLNTFLFASVAIAALLAVVMVAIGGFKWMTTDSVFVIGNAKEQIQDAIVGLLIVLMAVLVLKTINPELLNLDLFNASKYEAAKGGGGERKFHAARI